MLGLSWAMLASSLELTRNLSSDKNLPLVFVLDLRHLQLFKAHVGFVSQICWPALWKSCGIVLGHVEPL